ncbi:MAG: heavy metal-associated domain-containing protein [Alkalispirochaeta sp.]
MKKTILRSNELSCPSCIAKIEKRLSGMAGVERATVHFNTGKIEVVHDPEHTDQDQLVTAVAEVGYAAHPSRM